MIRQVDAVSYRYRVIFILPANGRSVFNRHLLFISRALCDTACARENLPQLNKVTLRREAARGAHARSAHLAVRITH